MINKRDLFTMLLLLVVGEEEIFIHQLTRIELHMIQPSARYELLAATAAAAIQDEVAGGEGCTCHLKSDFLSAKLLN